jgi:Fe2+-dicitrate sensor, membrane component
MNNSRLSELLDKYLSNSITESEKDQLLLMIQSNSYVPELERVVDQHLMKNDFDQEENDELRELIFERIKQRIPARARIAAITWRRIAAAAAVVIFLVMGYVLIINHKKDKPIAQHHEQIIKNDVQPGKYKAKLTLANGQTIIINDSTSRELARQGNATIVNSGNQLIYQTKKNSAIGVLYNTLSTGRGETYSMVLSDGSKVWLNSISSIRFPVTFAGKERKVEITGEAYFQVKHNPKMPFKLNANGVEVQDLGTEFNVNDYNDEPVIKTTLVSGKAKVIKGNKNHLLDPGQEVQIKQDELIFIANADIEQTTAWKNGLFRFRGTDVGTVMRQLARWYNVDVDYQDKIPDGHFTGMVNRGVTLVEVLKMLELSGIHSRLNGTRLTVTP